MSSDSAYETDSDASTTFTQQVMEPYIQLIVKDQNGGEKCYQVKDWTTMEKLKTKHAAKVGVPVESLRFVFKGLLIANEDTAETLGLENGDIIEVSQE